MNDDERELQHLSPAEQDLARRLEELGPLLRAQAHAESEIDAAFARNLRAHLVQGEELAPHPSFARNLRERLLRRPAARPLRMARRRRPWAWIGAAVATVAAIIAGALIFQPQKASPSFTAPYPKRADLVFSFPAPAVAIHQLKPTVSLVHPASGVPYAGHLRLTAARLPKASSRLAAYRLAPPSNVVGLARSLLAIRARPRRMVVDKTTWAVAADGGFPSRRPLHSVAVSLRTGELIYHDRRNTRLPRARGPLDRRHAVSAARRWLSRLGWPGQRMPLRHFGNVAPMPKVRKVVFGWPGVGVAATENATLWVTPDGSIIEAWVWPPVARSGLIGARLVSAAWDEVRKGHLPLAVEGVAPTTASTGAGTLRHTTIVSVLTSGADGSLYLVPTYRFEGRAHIPGASMHTWYALAPSAQR